MNKALLMLLTAALLHFTAAAQIKKGTVLLGGNLSGYTQNSDYSSSADDAKQRGFFINPAVGIAFKENQIWGVNVGYGSGKMVANGVNTAKSNTIQGGIFYRRYLPLGKSFYLFGEGSLGYIKQKNEQQILNPNYQLVQQSNTSLNFYPGIAYAVSRRFILEASINNLLSISYNRAKEEYNDGTVIRDRKSNSFSFSSNVGTTAPLSVGFRFLLN